MIEPSDVERSEWPEATVDYVYELEAKVERLRELLIRIVRPHSVSNYEAIDEADKYLESLEGKE